ncbi:histidine--tRNA ligase [Tundrisphaera sp. TA3]|uniref:histidine--tRNA ligase n=1 Tax=Tundrisphaera sp. TA3 TaxID=3435775 RepID=UPI003EB7BB3C
MTRMIDPPADVSETPIPRVKGTADWLPDDFADLAALQALMLERFGRAGYDRLRTPTLEYVTLHERKSGAGIVGKLFELDGDAAGRVCLRPELTAGIVRAYADRRGDGPLPWRVSHAGTAFRRESSGRADRLREFRQVGVERLGDAGPVADAEVIWLAAWSLAEAGVQGATIRLGHVGLILEVLSRSGLPPAARTALVEMLSEAAAEGHDVGSLERGLDHFTAWLDRAGQGEEPPLAIDAADDGGVDRLFRTLVPVVTGRRSGHEIIHRLRRKWELGKGLGSVLDRVRDQIRGLSALKGPAVEVVDRLARDHASEAPRSVAALRALVQSLGDHGIDPGRIELDLGFGRGIGFYSRMIFEITAPTPGGPVEVCGGGRYDGLARVLGGSQDDRGVGFAFGLERLHAVVRAQGRSIARPSRESLRIVAGTPEANPAAIRLATRLRSSGVRVILDADAADRLRVEVAAGEPGQGSLTLHDPEAGTAVPVGPEDLIRLFATTAGESKP